MIGLTIKDGMVENKEKLEKKIQSLKDGVYTMDIQKIDGSTKQCMKYYRGVVLPDVSSYRGESSYSQHQLNLEMFSPKIVYGGQEYVMTSRAFSKEHWNHFLKEVIEHYLIEGIPIREAHEQIQILRASD
jgi:hypothetical protein